MAKFIFPLLIVLAATGAIVFFVKLLQARSRRIEQRRNALQQAATELNLAYVGPGDGFELQCVTRLPSFPIHRRGVSNVMRGYSTQDEAELRIFDFCYSTRNQPMRSTTVALFHSPRLSLPEFTMRAGKEHFFERLLMQTVNLRDIDFDTHRLFSQRYVLRGKDEAAVRTLFRTEILDHFQHRPDVAVDGTGDLLAYYIPFQSGRLGQLNPAQLSRFLADGTQVFRMFAAPRRWDRS